MLTAQLIRGETMKRLIKAGLMVLMGTVIWINGGMVEKAKAQECAPGGNVLHFEGYSVCNYIGGNCVQHQPGQIPPSCLPQPEQPANPKPIIQKPSSYGAVAWSIQKRKLGISSQQSTKQASISAAIKQCGDDSCVVSATYSNSCIALGYGESKSPNKTGQYIWFAEGGLPSETKSIEKMLRICNKVAKNCQVTFSECSLP